MWTEPGCVTFHRMSRIRAGLKIVRAHPLAIDALLALALAALVVAEVLTSREYLAGSGWVYPPVALVMTAFAVQSLILAPTPTPDVELIPALIAVYSVAAHGRRWVPYAGGCVG